MSGKELHLGPDRYRPRYPQSGFVHLADLVDISTGQTYRETNEAKPHNILVGALVELVSDSYPPLRLQVVRLYRDCDGTPLYSLGLDDQCWELGWPEEALKVIS